MIRKNCFFAALLAAALFAGVSAVAAQKQPAKAKVAPAEKKAASETGYKLGESELFTGTIVSFDAAASTITVTSNGVPYTFRLTGKTKVKVNGSNVALETLSEHVGHNASIHFVPYSKGNFAEHFEVSTT